MKRFISHSSFKSVLFVLAGVSVLLVVWKLVSLSVNSGLLVPPPELVLVNFISKLPAKSFWNNVALSSVRVIEGFLLSFIAGIVTGIACGRSRFFYQFSKPGITLTRVVPVLSIILLAKLWLGSNQVPVFVSFLMAFPVITGTVIEGMHSLDSGLEEMAKVYGLGRRDKLFTIVIPQLFPFILAGVRTALGLSWKVIIAAEILSLPALGIGTEMQNAQLNIETADVFSWTIAAVLVSALFDFIARLLMSVFDWRKKSGQTK